MKIIKILVITILIVVFFILMRYNELSKSKQDIMAIWVPRFDFSTSNDVSKIIKNCSEIGFTDIFFQIRGHGTIYFKSDLEPWAYELFPVNSDYINPGWDPLKTAINLCRQYNVRLHAYMNVLPGWKGLNNPPENSEHLWNNNRDYFMVDYYGDTMKPTQGWYSFLNPSHPEVKSHLKKLTHDIIKYDIDGLHLDYIRYPYDYFDVADQIYTNASVNELRNRSDFSYDKHTINGLKDQYGSKYTKSNFREFKTSVITDLVKFMTTDYKLKTNIVFSASVLANPTIAKFYAAQDSIGWIDSSLLDWVVQMNYGSKTFNKNLKRFKKKLGRKKYNKHAVIGIYVQNDKEHLIKQLHKINYTNPKGTAVFSYGLLFDEHKINDKGIIIREYIKSY